MTRLLLNTLFLAASIVALVSTAEDTADRAKDIQHSLYAILRTIALPDASHDQSSPVQERFVLQVPGKQLNPMDYDPTNYADDISKRRLSTFIPPKIEENMFWLTDVVPVANPMEGGETGESFMDMYEAVLNQLDVRGFDKMTSSDRKRYQQAIDYLAQSIADPEDLTRNETRLNLYIRFQKRYNDARLKMEDEIKKVKDKYEDKPVEYQLWFQTHYPSLYANVENIYTDWLVFGEKDLVELYKAHLDVQSQGVAVEEARMSLRSSGKVTMDRSSTVYPVHIEPSNWYEYLRAKPQPLSKEQIQAKLGDMEARIATLESMKETPTSEQAKAFIDKLEKEQEEAKKDLATQTSDLDAKRLDCMTSNDGEKKNNADEKNADDKKKKCEDYRTAQDTSTEKSMRYSALKVKTDYAKSQFRANEESKKTINGLISDLQTQKKHYESMLKNAPADVLDVPKTSSEGDTQDFQAGWMEFEFDSSKRSEKTDQSAKTYAASLSFGVGGFGWGVSGGAGYSRSEQDFAQKVSQADVKISGKVLKVTIKRPWFKTSLFKSNQLMTLYNQKVSPGPMPERDFIDALQSRSETYLLPQFVNAFLLAKDVSMEFQGVDSSVTSHAIQQSASARLSGHYGPFSASASFSYGSSESHMQAESTADGFRIKIPGAQLIGYYVTVLPCFPTNLCSKN